MRGVRYLLRDFTAKEVGEHLRSQVEDRDGEPDLTPNELELVRTVHGRSFDWEAYLAQHPEPK